MAARRCSGCARNHPLTTLSCPSCGVHTWYSENETPDDQPSAAEEQPQPPLSDLSDVEAWRLTQLLDAGYPADHACRIAEHHDIDLHQALELLEHGCSSELAAQILL